MTAPGSQASFETWPAVRAGEAQTGVPAQPIALVVERREYPANAVFEGLVRSGYHVLERQWAGSVELAALLRPTLIVAAVSPSRAADLEVVRELSLSCDAFVVLLADSREGLAAGLLAGATACLCDADGPDVIAAQFAAVVRGSAPRRAGLEPLATAVAGPLMMDVAAHRASYFGRPLRLSKMEFAILLYLVQHQGAMCHSSRMVAALMGDELSDSDAGARLRSHVLRIRRQLRWIEPGHELISNVRGMGYRLDAPPEPGTLA